MIESKDFFKSGDVFFESRDERGERSPVVQSKLIPDMTHEELTQMLSFYGPDHRRTAKIAKEIARRAQAVVLPVAVPVFEPVAEMLPFITDAELKQISRKFIPDMSILELKHMQQFYGPSHNRAPKIVAEIAQREKSSTGREAGSSVSALPMVSSRPIEPITVFSETVEPAPVSSSLTVGLGEGLYPAESIEDAQAKWLEFRGLAEKQGATPGSVALSTVTQNGAKVGHIDLDGQFVSVDAQTFEGDAQPLNAIFPAGAALDRSLAALIPLASQTPDDQRRLASNFLREVTSETARKATYDFEGVAVSVIEGARAGEFAVKAAGDTYGTFKIDEAGLVTSRRARAEWAKPWIRFASESFARDFGPKKVLEADTEPAVPISGVVNDGPVRAGDVFTYGAGEAATVMRTLPGGRAEVRIQGTKLRVGETRVSNLKKLERLGRAEYLDGSYTTPAALIDAAKGVKLAQDGQSIEGVLPLTAAGNDSASAVQFIETGEIYETPDLDQRSSGSLAGAPAEDVRAIDVISDSRGGVDAGGSGNVGSDPSTDLSGDQPPGRLDAGERAIPVPARRGRADAGDGAQPGLRGARGADEGLELAGVGRGELTPEIALVTVAPEPIVLIPQLKFEDFTITDELKLGEGGQKAKYKDNIAAIKLLVELEDANQQATPEQQKVLAKYVGWGGLAQAFDDENSSWKREYKELRELLSPEDFDAARKSTRYAHYTSAELIVDGIYAALKRFGFEGGKTLEAGAGVGNFMGLMPPEMRSAGRFTAIEREPFAASIAKQLYPLQNVQVADFTEFKGNDSFYDAVVGNPPFASDAQVDMSGRKHLSGLSLHNYFFAKGVDMLREGGIMAQVVTSSFMDAANDKTRKYISDRARLLGAIRLPNNAFLQNAGTEVTTDVIFLQKLSDAEIGGKLAKEDGKRWLSTGKFKDPNGYRPLELNQYFIDNPDMMLGQFGSYGTMYGQGQPALVARKGQDTLALLRAAVVKLPANVYTSIAKSASSSADLADAAITALENPAVKEGGYFVLGDKLMQRLPDLGGEARGTEVTADTFWTAKTKLGVTGVERIKALAVLRTTTRGLIAAEMADDEMGMQILRVELNKQYDAYQVTYGMLNDPGTVRVFDDDPDFPLLASLEHGYKPGIGAATAKRLGVKETPSTATKSPIFSQRVVAARAAIMKVETPADALAVSMAEKGKLDAAYIGELLGREPEEVLRELRSGDDPLLFGDPSTDEYVLRDAYLSGNVRLKLKQAREAGMSANIRALEAVQPEDVPSHEIVGRLGAPWIPTKVYEAFAHELFGKETQVNVFYMALNSSFQVSVRGAAEAVVANRWGTPQYHGNDLLQALMNNKVIKVTYVDAEKKVRTDVEASDQANMKAQEIKDRFSDWLFSDPDRSGLLTQTYNETNNNYVTRVYDGSTMTYPGKVPDSIIKHRRHQRNGASRIVQDRTVLLDHIVGSGKTYTVVTGAMELKRTGLASKSMVAVPNHLVKQWAADFYRLYPGANILTATKKDFEKVNRRKFLARIATGDWDAVVIAHSSFGFIRPSADFELSFSQQEVEKVMATIQEVAGEEIEVGAKRRTVKQLEGIKEKLVNRIKALRDKPMDDLLDFGQLGVNQLFVDEAHCFPHHTIVTTDRGPIAIGELVRKRLPVMVLSVDSLTSALQWKQVTDWFSNRVTHYPVRVTHERGTFECTANHQIWTHENGYIDAGSLLPHHTLRLAGSSQAWPDAKTGGEGLRLLQEGIQLQVIGENKQRQAAVLHESMCGDLAQRTAGGAGAIRGNAWPHTGGFAERDKEPGIVGADANQQPDDQSRDSRQDGGFIDGAHIPGTRGKWEDHCAAADAARSHGPANGVSNHHDACQGLVQVAAEPLQGGPGGPGTYAGHRSGWEHAQTQEVEVSRCPQDRGAERARVVSVEVLEQGGDGRPPCGFEPDSSVYCLEVEDNHNFFAEGVLVSNCFKNLMYTTKMQQVQGLGDGAGSQRAYDMYIKCNEIMAMNGRDQGVVFATGTPVSNSLAEMYHMMRYLMPTVMKDMGFSSFDAWANTFASVEQVWMQAPSGDGFKVSNRMSNFVNTPELLKIFDQVCDTVTMDEIKQAYSEENDGAEFPIPKLKGGRRTPVAMLKSPAQDAYMALIADRARVLESRGGPPKKGDDNILVIMGDARKCAMDIRLVDLTITEREKGGRIDVATDHAVANYHKFADVKGTQIIFSDLGTPLKHAKAELKEYEALQERIQAGTEDVTGSASLGNERAIGIMEDVEAAQAELDAKGGDWLDSVRAALRGFSVYDDYRAALVEKGIPAAEIAFIHDYNTDEQKAALFRKMNSGEMRFVLGSTAKLGAGTNVQERLVSEQHLDVPWRPSDVEQREGRIIRQGNVLMTLIPDFEVEVLAFVTKDTLDMRMWQTQEVKLKMINQLRMRKIGREVDNAFEDMELSAGEMQAAATGDLNLLKEIQHRTEIKKLEQKRRSFEAQANDLHNRKVRATNQLADLPRKIEAATIESVHINAYRHDAVASKPVFAMNIDGQDYADSKAARAYLAALDGARVETTSPDGTITSKAAPIQVVINGEPVKSRAVMGEIYSEAVGDDEPIKWAYNGSSYYRRSKIETAIMKVTLDCIAQESLVNVGTLGSYAVAIEAAPSRLGNTELDVTLSRDGVVVMSRDFIVSDTAQAAGRVIRLAESMMNAALNDVTYLAFSLQKAQAESAALQSMQDLGKWPDADKLVAVRAAHQEVLNLLKQKNAKKPGEEKGTPGADSHALEVAQPLRLTPEIASTLAAFIEATGCEFDDPVVLSAHQILSELGGDSPKRLERVVDALVDGDLDAANDWAKSDIDGGVDNADPRPIVTAKPSPPSVKSASQFSTVEYP